MLNIDLIDDFMVRLPVEEANRIILATNELVGIFRDARLPVIWVRQEFAPDLSDAFLEMRGKGVRTAIAGTIGAQLDERLDVHSSDIVIVKKRYSAFFGTELDESLAALGSDEIVITGVNTHACIRTTAIDAYQRDLKVVLASDCMGSYDQEHGSISMRYMDGKIGRAMTNSAIKAHVLSGA